MSQKKLKRLRRVVNPVEIKEEVVLLPRFREIIKKNWLFLVAMSLVAILLYANAFRGDFVSDDYATITQNPYIGDFWYNLKLAGFGNTMIMSNYFVYKFFGFTSSIPYHLMSMLWFLAFNILAFVLVRLVTNNEKVAMLTMVLFVFHPIHVEAVSWIAGRVYLVLGVYICASVISFIYFIEKGRYRYLIWSGVFFLLGFMTDRPRPFGAIMLMGLYVLFLGWKKVKDKVSTLIKLFGALALICLVVAWPYITNRINVVNSGYNASESIFYNPFFQYPIAITKYLQLLFIPVDLTLYHTMYVLPGWLNWLILINYLALVVYFYIKDKRYFWALSFIFVSIFPSMSPIKVSWLVAERYMFLGSLGFCWFLGLFMVDHWKKLKVVMPIMLVSILAYYGIRVFKRNIDWRTNHNLWVNTCQISPNSHNAWNNIGDDYDKFKDYDNAIKGFTQSVLVKPNYGDAYHNRANIFFKINRLDLARESYDTALRFSPGLYQTYLSLTQIDLNEKKGDLALAHATKAAELQPDDPQSQYVLGIVNAQIGRIDEARIIFQKILIAYPNYTPVVEALKQLNSIMVGKS